MIYLILIKISLPLSKLWILIFLTPLETFPKLSDLLLTLFIFFFSQQTLQLELSFVGLEGATVIDSNRFVFVKLLFQRLDLFITSFNFILKLLILVDGF